MERKMTLTTKTVQAMIAGFACTAVATTTVAPSFAGPARLPAIAAASGTPAMPLLVQTQQKGTGTTSGRTGTTSSTSGSGTGSGTSGTNTGGKAGTGTSGTSGTSTGSGTGSQSGGGTGGQSGGGSGGRSTGSGTAGNDDSTGSNNGPARARQFSDGPKSRIYYYINSNATDRISGELSSALSACDPDRLESRYRVDCLRLHFWRLSRELPATGDYAPVRAALAKAAADLDAIVRQNLDTSAPRVRVRVNGKPAAPLLPPIRAVRPDAEARVADAAERVIAEATTALLRSTENSDRRMTHYQQIAAAISSTKVLLRSA